MMVYHGVADGALTIQQTFDRIKDISAANRGNAPDFVRMYEVPGMGHCRGAASASNIDMLTAAQEWVEKGQVP